MNVFTFSKPANLLLHYGLFAVICHSVFIFLLSTTLEDHSMLVFTTRVFPMLEHSLVSFVSILVGALGLEYIEKVIKS